MVRGNENNEKTNTLGPVGDEDLRSVCGAMSTDFAAGMFYALASTAKDPAVKAFFSGAEKGVSWPL
jgi:hypothetical protein